MLHSLHSTSIRAIAIFVVCGITAGTWAKTPPSHVPELDSPDYWAKNTISFAVVVPTSDSENVPIKIVEQFTAGRAAPDVLDMKNVTLAPYRDPGMGPRVALSSYDHLLIIREADGQLVAYQAEGMAISRMAESCRTIQRVRDMKEMTEKLKAIISAADAVAQRYVLNELQASPPAIWTDAVVAQIRALRADPIGDMRTRILASRTLEKIALSRKEPSDDQAWLIGVLRQERKQDFDDLRIVAERLVQGHQDQRDPLIDVLCELGNDATQPWGVRSAILLSGSYRLMNRTTADDAGNLKLVNLGLTGLKDSSPLVRSSAEGHLVGLMEAIKSASAATRGKVTEPVVQALRVAADRETQIDLKVNLGQSIEQIQEP